MTDLEDEDYYVPLQDQRVFGAGIKRKRINFVPASTSEPSELATAAAKGPTIASRYLSIVLPKPPTAEQVLDEPASSTPASVEQTTEDGPPVMCPVCSQSISPSDNPSVTHESSISHQLCLDHVHPPSHLPRTHIGVRYLTSHGWDPDARRGLGARLEGITVPIKAKEKNDTAGLRENVDENEMTNINPKREGKTVKLNAKELKVQYFEAKRRAERLRQNFYGPDLEKYLGPDHL
jgi:hypothetical protein